MSTTIRHVASIVDRAWGRVLVATLGAYAVVLGATTFDIAGVLGVVGGLLTIALAVGAERVPRAFVIGGLALAVAPFAILTWWSVVTPLLALVTLVIGITMLRRRSSPVTTSR
jgi:hypothetical protein